MKSKAKKNNLETMKIKLIYNFEHGTIELISPLLPHYFRSGSCVHAKLIYTHIKTRALSLSATHILINHLTQYHAFNIQIYGNTFEREENNDHQPKEIK